jgi:hypothetical protein
MYAILGLSTSWRNICVEVRVKDCDDYIVDDNSYETKGNVKCLFDKSHSEGITDCVRTSLLYHEQAPTFSDEIKMMLIHPITEKHHLLFTFVYFTLYHFLWNFICCILLIF